MVVNAVVVVVVVVVIAVRGSGVTVAVAVMLLLLQLCGIEGQGMCRERDRELSRDSPKSEERIHQACYQNQHTARDSKENQQTKTGCRPRTAKSKSGKATISWRA